jgi:hypothetical protein
MMSKVAEILKCQTADTLFLSFLYASIWNRYGSNRCQYRYILPVDIVNYTDKLAPTYGPPIQIFYFC